MGHEQVFDIDEIQLLALETLRLQTFAQHGLATGILRRYRFTGDQIGSQLDDFTHVGRLFFNGEAKFIRIVREADGYHVIFCYKYRTLDKGRIFFEQQLPFGITARLFSGLRQLPPGSTGLVDQGIPATELARPFFQRSCLDSMVATIDKLKFDIKALQPIAGFFASITIVEAVNRIHQSIIVIVGATVAAFVIARTRYRDFRRSYG